MTSITIANLTKQYVPGNPPAVDSVNLTINSGELFFLLGPSGCGKTTLLRMIAGFIEPTAGSIRFGDRDVTSLPPNRRNTGMVFQSYALWPHMTVEENVGYGLVIRKVPAQRRRDQVMEALRSVHMEPYAKRKPNQLSGGQQQRVALARALVIEPTVLLLDEPLSNLDAKLRLEMRSEIRRICKQTKITTVYVTHDQKEALSMADSMAVLRDGRIVQLGPPRQVYEQPHSRFVAEFLGETNFLSARVQAADNGGLVLHTTSGVLHSRGTTEGGNLETPFHEGQSVTCSIRPEALRIVLGEQRRATPSGNRLRGRRVHSIFLGEIAQHSVELSAGVHLRVLELHPSRFETGGDGEDVEVEVSDRDIVVLRD